MQIDWLTVAAQIVNFLVLVWLLQRFLYRPITEAMARREARIETRLAEARDARAEVEAEARRLRERQAELDAARDATLQQARQDAADLRQQLEEDLRQEMGQRRKAWEDHLLEDRAAFADRLRREAGHEVIGIVARVLRDYTGGDIAGQMADSFATRLATLDTDARDKLARAAGRPEACARVDSSMPLGPEERARLTRAIQDTVAPGLEVEFVQDDTLLLGLRLTIGAQTLEWSAAHYLDRLKLTLDEIIDAGRGDDAPPRQGQVNGR
jgi:F-type H+-transporting ATPase subunit b